VNHDNISTTLRCFHEAAKTQQIVYYFYGAPRLFYSRSGYYTFSMFLLTLGSLVLRYGAAIEGDRRMSCIAADQNRALRFVMGVGRYTANAAVGGDTGC
jgi:hypothetical protein